MTIEEWLGEDNILGIDIWKNKYRENDESFDEWLDRVSGGNYELKMLILDQKFLFGGRTLSNRGTNKKGSFSNCYSRGFVEDNLEDLMQANTDINGIVSVTLVMPETNNVNTNTNTDTNSGVNNNQNNNIKMFQ